MLEDFVYRLYRWICFVLRINNRSRDISDDLPIVIERDKDFEIDKKAADHWVCRRKR